MNAFKGQSEHREVAYPIFRDELLDRAKRWYGG
jgi:hypothetical protein